MFSFNPAASLADNQSAMDASLDTVKSGQVTAAVRDTKINGLDIKKGRYMGIVDGKIEVIEDTLNDATISMLKKMLTEDSENVTIIFGEGATQADADLIESEALKTDPELEVEIHEGDQPVYPLLISVE